MLDFLRLFSGIGSLLTTCAFLVGLGLLMVAASPSGSRYIKVITGSAFCIVAIAVVTLSIMSNLYSAPGRWMHTLPHAEKQIMAQHILANGSVSVFDFVQIERRYAKMARIALKANEAISLHEPRSPSMQRQLDALGVL